jgi:hypothetical protein
LSELIISEAAAFFNQKSFTSAENTLSKHFDMAISSHVSTKQKRLIRAAHILN